MKPMKKTDFCASVLCDAMVTINGIPKLLELSTSEIEALKNSEDKGKAAKEHLLTLDEKSIFITEDDALEVFFPKRELIKKLTRLKSLFWYRILPAYNIDIEGKGMDNVYTDLYLANQYTGGDYYNIVWETLQDQSISLKDLEDELWENLRGVDEINKYLEITRVKFNPITSHISDLKKFSMQNLFYTDNQYKNGLHILFEVGIINNKEEDLILKLIYSIARSITTNIELIASMYNGLKEMNSSTTIITESNKEPISTDLPDELNTEKARSLLQKAIDGNYIDGSTYKWDYSIRGKTALLAYFIDKASDYLELRDDSERIPWAKFLFLMKDKSDISYLKGVVSDYSHPERPKPEPNGFRTIKEWFR